MIDLPGIARLEIAPHHCFACGTLNATGMQLDLHVEPGRSWTELVYDVRFQGWDGIAHGGILATILDEVMAWALVGDDSWGLTARMSIDFQRPVSVGQRLRAEGWVTASRRRLVDTRRTPRRCDRRAGPGQGDRRLRGRRRGAQAQLRRRYALAPEVGTPVTVDQST